MSGIPDLTAAVSVPRLAAVEHPLGYLLGQPGDSEGQLRILRATLQALAEMDTPGRIAHLPFEWPEEMRRMNAHPPKAPPISRYLMRHPWQIPNLMARDIPGAYGKPEA